MEIDTGEMSAKELKGFIQDELVPVLNQKWDNRGYVFAMCDCNNFVVIELCESCGLATDERYYFQLSDDEEIDLAEYLDAADYDNPD